MCYECCARCDIICCWTCVEEPYTTMMHCSFFLVHQQKELGTLNLLQDSLSALSSRQVSLNHLPIEGANTLRRAEKMLKNNNAVVRSVTCHWSVSVWVPDNVSAISVVRLMLLFCLSVWCFVLDLCRASRCCLLFYSITTSWRRKSLISGNADPANNEEKA